MYPACQNLLLAARALGYGGALTGWHHGVEPELRELLGIPDEVAVSACITLGRPAGHHGPVRRKPLAELVYDDEWGPRRRGRSTRPGRAHEVDRVRRQAALLTRRRTSPPWQPLSSVDAWGAIRSPCSG